MPRSQVAAVSNYDVGVPLVEAPLLRWKLRNFFGGKLTFRFEHAAGDATPQVSIQVSEDGASFVDTTATDNLVAVVDEAIPPRQNKSFEIGLRSGEDNFVQVIGFGGDARLHIQVDGNEKLDTLLEGPDLSALGPVSP